MLIKKGNGKKRERKRKREIVKNGRMEKQGNCIGQKCDATINCPAVRTTTKERDVPGVSRARWY